MVRYTKMINDLSEFFKKYPETGQPGQPLRTDEEYREALHSLCEGIIVMEISYTCDRHMVAVLLHANNIMKHFTTSDILSPLCFTDYQLFLKLSTIIGRLKNVLIDNNCATLNNIHLDIYFSYKSEQHIVDSYKCKLKKFKTECNEEEILHLNELFTSFLIEYVRVASKSCGKIKLKANLEYLIEVGDLKLMIDSFHKISHLIPSDKKIPILQKITTFFIKNNILGTFKLLNSVDSDFRLDLLSMCYFIFQNICEQLEEQKLNQTSQILSKLTTKDIISLSDPVKTNTGLEEVYEEAVNLITFEKYKAIKAVPSDKIKKNLEMLSLLLDSLRKYHFHNYNPFGIILVSMLSEFVMATDLNKSCIESLIDLIIGYLFIGTLPSNFGAVSYAFHIYQKLKSDHELVMKSSVLFGKLVTLDLFDLKKNIRDDLEEIINSKEDWVDKCVILSRFLNNSIKSEDETLSNLFYALNECIMLSSQYRLKNGVLLFPYTVSLCYSLENKNEDCLFSNLALLNDYFNISMDPDQMVPLCDKNYFLTVVVRNYKDISQCLSDDFLIKTWIFAMSPESMNLQMSKQLLNLCDSNTLTEFIKILINKTMKLVKGNEELMYETYYSHMNEVWSILLNMQFTRNKNKKVRKDLLNHFCFTLNKTFLFNNTIPTEPGLIVLMKIVCLLLKIPWINTTALMGGALRIITSIETRNISQIQLLIDASELLIVLYKCPNNSIKSNLGLYVISFIDILSKCCVFAKYEQEHKRYNNDINIPFHKLEKCSSLFKNNKNDFVFICSYMIENLIEVIMSKNQLPQLITKNCYHIIFNLMDMCSPDEMKHLMLNVRGPSLLILRSAYREYLSNIRYSGRI